MLNATHEEAKAMDVTDGWLSRHILDPEIKDVLVGILGSHKARKASKQVCMPLVYGAKLPSMMSSIRKCLLHDFKLDLSQLFLDRVYPNPDAPNDRSKDISYAFECQNKVVTEVTCYLYQAASLLSQVMESLAG